MNKREANPVYALPSGYRLEEFEILTLLGEGGFGLAYLAYDHVLKQQRVIKEFLPGAVAQRGGSDYRVSARSEDNQAIYVEGLHSFINEARLLASLDHPHVVRVYRCLEANGTAYLVMHYYQGETLKQRLKRGGGEAPAAAWVHGLLTQLLHGLDAVHGQGILHRDIKPSNIYMLADDRPVLIDFGAARRVVGGRTKALTGVVTEGYSPPEQYTGNGGLQEGPWTDLYALGATFYEMVTAHKPRNAVMRITGDEQPSALALGKAHYPAPLLASIDRALAIRPEARYRTAAEWRVDLEGVTRSVRAAPGAVPAMAGVTGRDAGRQGLMPPVAVPVITALATGRLAAPRLRKSMVGVILALGVVGGSYWAWQGHRLPSAPTGVPPSPAPPAASVVDQPPSRCPSATESAKDLLATGRYAALLGNYPVAIRCYRDAADRGDADAPYHLGLLYEKGSGVAPDLQEAIRWYRKAAMKEQVEAMIRLSLLYRDGVGVSRNYAEAARWFQRAAERQYHLGVMYATGRGVRQDDAEAVRWYRQAAERGHALAHYSLGGMYETGGGVTRDQAEAVRWYRKAAEQGHAKGQDNLGVMYASGRGVSRDDAEAVRWFRQAAELGDAMGQYLLGWMYLRGCDSARDPAEAVRWFRQAAGQGHDRAQYSLGVLYEQGWGVPRDRDAAQRWRRQATDQGLTDSQGFENLKKALLQTAFPGKTCPR